MTTSKYWNGYYKIKVTHNINMIGNFNGRFDVCEHNIKNIAFKFFVKNNDGTISGIKFKGGKLVNDNVYGFVLNNEKDGIIQNCMVDMNNKNVNIKADLVFANKSKITNSKTTLSVKSGDDRAGGFVSENSGTIEKCTAKRSVKGHDNVGGFVGNNYCTMEICVAKGKVSENEYVGGFSDNNHSNVEMCTAIGKVNGKKIILDKFVGKNEEGKIEKCKVA